VAPDFPDAHLALARARIARAPGDVGRIVAPLSATVAAAAAYATVRGENPDRNPEMRPTRSKDRRAGAGAPSASIAANSFSMARADGTPSDSLRWIVSCCSSRTSIKRRARSLSFAIARSTRSRSRRLNVPAACHGRRASISWRSGASLLTAFMANLFRFPPP